MGFRRGDHVVYPKYGVGKVVKAEERPVFGRTQRCLEIRFPTDRRRVFVQEEEFQRAHIRPVMGSKMLGRVYKVLREPPELNGARLTRRRLEHYATKATIADPMSLAEVARDLVRRSQTRRLNEAERQLAESAVGLLTEEIALIERREPGKVRTKIERILNR